MAHPGRRNWSGQPWLLITNGDLDIERRQAVDEGLTPSRLRDAVEAHPLAR